LLLVTLLPDHRGSHALGHLEYLWNTAYENGKENVGNERAVELAADWGGEPGMLCRLLVECGFLDRQDDGTFAIHDLWDHAPVYVQRRREREMERERRGTTLSKVRSKAGKKGMRKRWKEGKLITNDNKRKTLATNDITNGSAPAPAPAPAPHERKKEKRARAHVTHVTNQTMPEPVELDASHLLARSDLHPDVMPFLDYCRTIIRNVPRWFPDEVESAFALGVTIGEARKMAKAHPEWILNPRRLAEKLIEAHTKKSAGDGGGPHYKEIKHNPDGSPDLSEYR